MEALTKSDNMSVCFSPFQFSTVKHVAYTDCSIKEPARKKLKSESKGETNGTIAKASGIPQSVVHSLYSESVAAKLWNVASRALGKVFMHLK